MELFSLHSHLCFAFFLILFLQFMFSRVSKIVDLFLFVLSLALLFSDHNNIKKTQAS